MPTNLQRRRSGGLLLPTETDQPQVAIEASPVAVDMLLLCHQRVHAQCETLQRLTAYLGTHGVDQQAKEAATGVMRYFDLAAPLHHADEEHDWLGVLQPLWEHDSTLMALLDRLRTEHRQLEAYWQALRLNLLSVVEATPGQHLDLPSQPVQNLVQAYQAHIVFEEGEWLLLAKQAVSPEVIARLGVSMVARRRQG